MGRKTVALSLDSEIYRKYQEHCEKKHLILSRTVESFMEKEMEGDNIDE